MSPFAKYLGPCYVWCLSGCVD